MVHESKKLISWTSSKFKTFASQKTPLRNEKIKNKLGENIGKHISNMMCVQNLY